MKNLERDAQNWQIIARAVRVVDEQHRGHAPSLLADDDVLDCALNAIFAMAKDKTAARMATAYPKVPEAPPALEPEVPEKLLPLRIVLVRGADGGICGLTEEVFSMSPSTEAVRVFWSGKAFSIFGEEVIDGVAHAEEHRRAGRVIVDPALAGVPGRPRLAALGTGHHHWHGAQVHAAERVVQSQAQRDGAVREAPPGAAVMPPEGFVQATDAFLADWTGPVYIYGVDLVADDPSVLLGLDARPQSARSGKYEVYLRHDIPLGHVVSVNAFQVYVDPKRPEVEARARFLADKEAEAPKEPAAEPNFTPYHCWHADCANTADPRWAAYCRVCHKVRLTCDGHDAPSAAELAEFPEGHPHPWNQMIPVCRTCADREITTYLEAEP